MNTTYAIRVDGHLDDHWSAWLGRSDLTRDDDGTTTLTVSVADQAQLHGVLAGLRDIGAVLTEVRTTSAPIPILERPLHTERLTLRPATTDDAGRLECLARYSGPDRLPNTVVVALGHAPAAPIIGDVMLRREDTRARGPQAELAWALDPAHDGHGYATEAVRELLRHCFQDLGVRRVTATCFLADDTSWRLLERLGMRREQHAIRDSRHHSGRWLDTVGYAILEEEWSPT